MVIREAHPRDAASIAALAGQLGYRVTETEIAGRLRSGSHRRAILVAEDGRGEPAGWAEVTGTHHLISGPVAELAALIVDESRRGQGIGRGLVQRALLWARHNGYPILRVRTNVLRERAHRFYADQGFEREKTQYVFRIALGPEEPGPPRRA
ncbi:MAG: GNAT family N-acetyltransferase [Candidatus Eisenbacteria bacterium]